MLNQLSEPGVINVAAKVACFDVAMPEAGNQNQRGDYEYSYPVVSDESGRRREGVKILRNFARGFLFLVRRGDQHVGPIQIKKPLQILLFNKHTTLSRRKVESDQKVTQVTYSRSGGTCSGVCLWRTHENHDRANSRVARG